MIFYNLQKLNMVDQDIEALLIMAENTLYCVVCSKETLTTYDSLPYHERCISTMGDTYNENLKKMKEHRKQITAINLMIHELKTENEKLTSIATYAYNHGFSEHIA
jgi:hypothetical protein